MISFVYAKGMTTRDINAHMQDIYGIDVSSSMISSITDKVQPLVHEWQVRPLNQVYPQAVRRLIYTTNGIESLHRQLRKATKTTSIFPHDEALTKLLWLAQRDITKKWNMSLRNWGEVIGQLSIMFPNRIKL